MPRISQCGGRGANSAVGISKNVKGGYDRTPAIEWTIQVDHPWILVDLGDNPVDNPGLLSLGHSAVTRRVGRSCISRRL